MSPKAFDDCQKAGGRIRTIKPNAKTYLRICYPKGGGPPVKGEVKKAEENWNEVRRK